MHTNWPTELQIKNLGEAANLPNASNRGGFVAKAIAVFESKTGWNPWLPDGTASQFLDAPEYWRTDPVYLEFPVTEADVYFGWSDSSQTGTLATENIDYVWVTYRLPGGISPKFGIKFLTSPGTRARCIKVTGTKGASCQIPDDLYQAILDGAFAAAIPTFRDTDGPVSQEKTGQVSITYGIEAGRSKSDELQKSFEDTVARYTPVKI